ncbi:MAG: EthD family reductase [Burkholderiales bacterium]
MIRVTVSYPTREGARFDHAYYQKQHAALIRELLTAHGLRRLEIDQALSDGAGKPAPVVAAAHMVFDDLVAFKSAMALGGKPLGADMTNYTDITPLVLISQIA